MRKEKLIAYSLLTLAWYLTLFLLFGIFDHASISGGPCNPGPLFIFAIASPILVLPLAISSVVMVAKGKKHHMGPFAVHVIFLMTFIIMVGLHP
jgi:hypothetical protein